MNRYILKNGLKITFHCDNAVDLVSISVFVKTGSRNELVGELGLSHLIEHILFSKLSIMCADMACEYNAITTKEYTCYYITCLTENLCDAVEFLSCIMNESVIREVDINKEIDIIKQEAELQKEDHDYILDTLLLKSVYGSDGLGNIIEGSTESLDNIDMRVLLSFYKKYYVVENMVFSFSGDLYDGNMRELCCRLSMMGSSIHGSKLVFAKQNVKLNHYTNYIYSNGATKCVVALPGCSYLDEDEPVYDLCAEILGGTNSSLLYTRLRNELGMVYNIYMEKVSYFDSGIMYLYFDSDFSSLRDVLLELRSVFQNVKVNWIDDELLWKMKRQLEFDIKKSYIENTAIMTEDGLSYLLERRNRRSKSYINKFKSVNKQKVQDIMNKILSGSWNMIYASPVDHGLTCDAEGDAK